MKELKTHRELEVECSKKKKNVSWYSIDEDFEPSQETDPQLETMKLERQNRKGEFVRRQNEWLEKRNTKLKQIAEKINEESMLAESQECTFQPKINEKYPSPIAIENRYSNEKVEDRLMQWNDKIKIK